MSGAADVRGTVLIEADALAERLRDPAHDTVVLHVGAGAGDLGIAGAVPVSLADFAGAGGGTLGERPLPAIATLQDAARGWGISPGSLVVLYDDKGGLQAARGWWVLRWAGVAQVRLLDGGLAAWRALAAPVAPLEGSERHGTVDLSPGHLPQVDADGAAALAARGTLLDARADRAFALGHIPGAISAPAAANLTDDDYFADPQTLQRHFTMLGVNKDREVAVSCGSGVSATHNIAALASIGIPAALYVASWSGWVADDQRPVQQRP